MMVPICDRSCCTYLGRIWHFTAHPVLTIWRALKKYRSKGKALVTEGVNNHAKKQDGTEQRIKPVKQTAMPWNHA